MITNFLRGMDTIYIELQILHCGVVDISLPTVIVSALCRFCTDWRRTRSLMTGSMVYSVTVHLTNMYVSINFTLLVITWVMRYWHGYLSGAKCKWLAYGLADATATPSSLLQKIKNSLSFWYRPTQVALEKKAIKRLCVWVYVKHCFHTSLTSFAPARFSKPTMGGIVFPRTIESSISTIRLSTTFDITTPNFMSTALLRSDGLINVLPI